MGGTLRSRKPSPNEVGALILTAAATGDRKLLRLQTTWEMHGAARAGPNSNSLALAGGTGCLLHPTRTAATRLGKPAQGFRVVTRDPCWDAFVLAVQGATVFHHPGWLAAAAAQENDQTGATPKAWE